MKKALALLGMLAIGTSCTTISTLNDKNCRLSDDPSRNFIGKWKVSASNGRFIWRFYSDHTTATLANQYLTQIFDRPVFLTTWQNDKIDTLRVFYDFNELSDRNIKRVIRPEINYDDRIDYFIVSKECRKVVLVDTRTSDTLTLKRKQYFYE